MAYQIKRENGKVIVRSRLIAMEFIALLSLMLTIWLLVKLPSDPEASKGLCASILFLVVAVATQRSGIYIFDTISRRIQYCKRSFFLRKQQGVIDFSDVESVTLQKYSSEGDTSYRIAITFNSDSILLNNHYEPYDSVLECFKQVHEILLGKLPQLDAGSANIITKHDGIVSGHKDILLSDKDQAKLLQMVAENRTIEAIKLVRSASNVDLKTAKKYVDDLKR